MKHPRIYSVERKKQIKSSRKNPYSSDGSASERHHVRSHRTLFSESNIGTCTNVNQTLTNNTWRSTFTVKMISKIEDDLVRKNAREELIIFINEL